MKRIILLLVVVSTSHSMFVPGSAYGQDFITECKKGVRFVACSKHLFLEDMTDLKDFAERNFDEVKSRIRCNRRPNPLSVSSDFFNFNPSDCGTMYGKYVKDVEIEFNQSGWLRKSNTFNDVNFKILGDRDTFNRIFNTMKAKETFSFLRLNGEEHVRCIQTDLTEHTVFEYRERKRQERFEKQIGDGLDPSLTALPDGPMVPGIHCWARGYFHDAYGNIDGYLSVDYFKLNGSEFQDVEVDYAPVKVSFPNGRSWLFRYR